VVPADTTPTPRVSKVPGGFQLLEAFSSWRLSVPAGFQLLEAFSSCRLSVPGSFQLLEAFSFDFLGC